MGKWLLIVVALLANGLAPAAARAACRAGIYGDLSGEFVVLGLPASATGALRYLFLDGRRGNLGDAAAAVSCDKDVVTFQRSNGAVSRWARAQTKETDAPFPSWGAMLAGRLIEPPTPPDAARPLVVLVHGSEKTPALSSANAYMLVAQGITVFVYDKRGTGASESMYTQNFELLAADASNALSTAKALAAGRFGKAGYYGGSQGGWIAPLAATRAPVDFVAVGFGLVASPIEEDREQMLLEARAAGLDAKATAQVRRLSDATAGLVRSHFERGFETLARVKRQIGDAAWARTIRGEYSGYMLRMEESDLRRLGRALFDGAELMWDYNGIDTLAKLNVPLLWVLAGEDQEAPVETTRKALVALQKQRKSVTDLYLFPDTDHGMVEFRVNADGSRTATRVTDDYWRLVADWLKGKVAGPYGRGQKLGS